MLKFRQRVVRRESIPRTNVLADITSKQPLSDAISQVKWYRFPAMLNRQIADTASRIQHAGFRKCIGRAGIKAARACTTVVVFDGFVVCQFDVGQDGSQKKPTADGTTDQHRIFPKPADAGKSTEVTFQQRCRVDDDARACRRYFSPQEIGQLLQSRFQYVMVVRRSPCIPSNSSDTCRLGTVVVIHGSHDDAACPRHDSIRMAICILAAFNPLHVGSMTVLNPLQQSVKSRRRHGGGNPDLCEAKLKAKGFQSFGNRVQCPAWRVCRCRRPIDATSRAPTRNRGE